MLTEQDKGRVYNSGIRLLARREYGVIEITKKLSQKHPRQLVEQVVSRLLEQNLLSDSRFAESLCNSRVGRGYGPVYISQELSIKGIAKEIIQEFIDKNDPAWLELAIKTGRKKASPLLLEKNFMQSEQFEEEFLRQKGVDELEVNADEELLLEEDYSLANGADDGHWDEDEYSVAAEEDIAEDTGDRLGSRKFNSLQKTKRLPKSKGIQSTNSLQKQRKMTPKCSQKVTKKIVYKKTKEQLFRELRQKDWLKVAGFLSRRGFPGELVSRAMNAIAPD